MKLVLAAILAFGSPSWGLDRIDQRALPLDASYTFPNTASNVHAYILDTGILTTHTDVAGRAVHGRDVVDAAHWRTSDEVFNATVRDSIASGVTHVVTTGSSSSNACDFSTGNVTEAITVAGSDINDNKHNPSNFGPCLDIFAPGVLVTTTWWTRH
jgi:subtilisin family serine protease